MRLFYFKLKEINQKLPTKITNHIESYKDIKRKTTSLYTWQHLAYILKTKYQIELKNEIIEFYLNGKPDLINQAVYFSLSHSSEYGVVLISDTVCGVDIQQEFDNLKLANKILNDIEKEEFVRSKNPKDYLNKKWVMKEAYAKAIGFGLNSEVYQKTADISHVIKIDNYYLACYPEKDFEIEVFE